MGVAVGVTVGVTDGTGVGSNVGEKEGCADIPLNTGDWVGTPDGSEVGVVLGVPLG